MPLSSLFVGVTSVLVGRSINGNLSNLLVLRLCPSAWQRALQVSESKHNLARAARAMIATDGGGSAAHWQADQIFGAQGTAFAQATVSEESWALPAYSRDAVAPVCYDVFHLGGLAADTALAHIGNTAVAATRYARHRPVSSKAAAAQKNEIDREPLEEIETHHLTASVHDLNNKSQFVTCQTFFHLRNGLQFQY